MNNFHQLNPSGMFTSTPTQSMEFKKVDSYMEILAQCLRNIQSQDLFNPLYSLEKEAFTSIQEDISNNEPSGEAEPREIDLPFSEKLNQLWNGTSAYSTCSSGKIFESADDAFLFKNEDKPSEHDILFLEDSISQEIHQNAILEYQDTPVITEKYTSGVTAFSSETVSEDSKSSFFMAENTGSARLASEVTEKNSDAETSLEGSEKKETCSKIHATETEPSLAPHNARRKFIWRYSAVGVVLMSVMLLGSTFLKSYMSDTFISHLNTYLGTTLQYSKVKTSLYDMSITLYAVTAPKAGGDLYADRMTFKLNRGAFFRGYWHVRDAQMDGIRIGMPKMSKISADNPLRKERVLISPLMVPNLQQTIQDKLADLESAKKIKEIQNTYHSEFIRLAQEKDDAQRAIQRIQEELYHEIEGGLERETCQAQTGKVSQLLALREKLVVIQNQWETLKEKVQLDLNQVRKLVKRDGFQFIPLLKTPEIDDVCVANYLFPEFADTQLTSVMHWGAVMRNLVTPDGIQKSEQPAQLLRSGRDEEKIEDSDKLVIKSLTTRGTLSLCNENYLFWGKWHTVNENLGLADGAQGEMSLLREADVNDRNVSSQIHMTYTRKGTQVVQTGSLYPTKIAEMKTLLGDVTQLPLKAKFMDGSAEMNWTVANGNLVGAMQMSLNSVTLLGEESLSSTAQKSGWVNTFKRFEIPMIKLGADISGTPDSPKYTCVSDVARYVQQPFRDALKMIHDEKRRELVKTITGILQNGENELNKTFEPSFIVMDKNHADLASLNAFIHERRKEQEKFGIVIPGMFEQVADTQSASSPGLNMRFIQPVLAEKTTQVGQNVSVTSENGNSEKKDYSVDPKFSDKICVEVVPGDVPPVFSEQDVKMDDSADDSEETPVYNPNLGLDECSINAILEDSFKKENTSENGSDYGYVKIGGKNKKKGLAISDSTPLKDTSVLTESIHSQNNPEPHSAGETVPRNLSGLSGEGVGIFSPLPEKITESPSSELITIPVKKIPFHEE